MFYARPPSAPASPTVRPSSQSYTRRLYRAWWTSAIGKCEQEMRIRCTKCEIGFFNLGRIVFKGCLFRP